MSTLRFERRLAYPVDRVWRAVSDPSELALWFPAGLTWTPELGEEFTSPDAPGTGRVTELDPPNLLGWAWESDRYRFEITPDGDGCVLVFTHVLDDPALAERHSAGWEIYLSRLEVHLTGDFIDEQEAHARFGRG